MYVSCWASTALECRSSISAAKPSRRERWEDDMALTTARRPTALDRKASAADVDAKDRT